MTANDITEDDIMADTGNYVQEKMVLESICAKEGITEKSDVYKDMEQEILELNGYSELGEAVSEGYTMWYVEMVVKYNVVMDILVENAVVTEVAAEVE